MAETDTLLQEFLNSEGTLELDTILLLPEGDRSVLGLNETLLEDMLEDVFKVIELVVLEFELDELSGGWLVDTRGLVVSKPEFSSSHDDNASRRGFRRGWEVTVGKEREEVVLPAHPTKCGGS